MQVLVRKSNVGADCACSICGQGFRLYWEQGTAEEQARAEAEVQNAIHSQHMQGPARSAHPEIPFTVPNWSGLPQFAEPVRRPSPFDAPRATAATPKLRQAS